jgi:homoserine O-acetyltransferase
MRIAHVFHRIIFGLALAAAALTGLAQNYPKPEEGSWVVKDYKFHTGEVLPEVRLHYRTVGAKTGEPVVVLHGTTQSGAALLNPNFAGELLGPGQALDATRYYVIFPDSIGHGGSSKPSDGLRAKFPRYNYDDMVDLHHRLVSEGLGVKRLRLLIGNSMGGMETWIWAQKHPGFMDIAVPMASTPIPMASRNWITRRLIVDSIRNDPAWMGGNYTAQPKSAQVASIFYGLATSGGNQNLQRVAGTTAAADKLLDDRLKAPFPADANDVLYQWDSSRDFDPSAGLEKIQATLLAINSADDERNPPETGLLESAIKRVRNGRILLIPGSDTTLGHGTTSQAKYWKDELAKLLQSAPKRAP